MKAREFNPRRLDVRPFAETGEPIDGTEALAPFERLVALRHAEASLDTAAPVRWSAQGELRPRRGGPPEVWLHLQGNTRGMTSVAINSIDRRPSFSSTQSWPA